ncbi:hypothetical protein BJ875DRAFT_463895 [Amylocarpus encephaloides]|uniref:Heterokaryon incompatibility domain-containing protein n=1 Tax=Amylocarpus encephaloides TaxID=45428 RepID=A0A9P7YH75_9HELO|nr:hypothetical protein BJ875DRAFT_463895 [Amylocarpus encephaloides]
MGSNAAKEFLQSWLFFALLAQILGRVIRHEDFIYGNDILSTRNLNHMLREWVEKEQKEATYGEPPEILFEWAEDSREKRNAVSTEQKNRYLRGSMALENARRFVSKHCSCGRLVRDSMQWEGEPPSSVDRDHVDKRLDTKMTLSLAILGETLQQARPKMLSLYCGQLSFFRDYGTEETSWGYSQHCRDMMKASGLCPLEIRRMESTMPSMSVVYYASSILTIDKRTCASGCTVWKCRDREKILRPLHMKTYCKVTKNCGERLGVSESEIIKIVREGKMPMVTFSSGVLTLVGYDVEKDTKKRFGVLSHSWEDAIVDSGRDLRNSNDRKMHLCQIETLQNTFNKLLRDKSDVGHPIDFPFYVDVLCMPKQHTDRGNAINQLKDIYRRASAVLVWDRNMLQRPKTDDKIEINMRLRTGDWSWRLWTFHETVLARKNSIYIAFEKEATISVSEIEQERDKVHQDPNDSRHHIWKAGHPFSLAISRLRSGSDYRVQRTWEAVQYRLIKYHSDETIVLASVLGLDVNPIEDIGEPNDDKETIGHKRMVKFLDLLDKTPGLGIPSGIIFLPRPRLPIPGYRWAPTTWLTKQLHPYPLFRPLRKTATIMKHGALVQFPGIILHVPPKPVEAPKFWFPVHQCMHKWYKVLVDTEGKNWDNFWQNEVCTEKIGPSIILCNGKTRDRWEVGVLVKNKGTLRQGEIRWVQILCRIWIRLETNPLIINQLICEMQAHGDQVMFGERLEEQEWCVDGDEA